MENQNPPFPFDAFELPDDLGVPDLIPPGMPASDGSARTTLEAIRRKVAELDDQLRTLLAMIDHELHAAPASLHVPEMSSARATPMGGSYSAPRPRPVDPLPSSLQREDTAVLRVIEGVFDGQNMVGPDGKRYSVPANYASKSRLVEGDILKLTITPRGAFVYKQIGPIARDRRIGVLERDDVTGEYVVLVPDAEEDRTVIVRAIVDRTDFPPVAYKRYRTLRASVTYYRGESGDEVVVLVPKDAPSTWASVENIIKR